MSSDIAGSAELIVDSPPPVATKTVRAYANKLFAEIAVRIVAYAIDMVVVLLAIVFTRDHFGIDLDGAYGTAVWVLLLFGYFAASWVSPMRATPVQFLFGLRVLHVSGAPLSLRDAGIRSAVLIAQWGLAIELLNLPDIPESIIGMTAAALLLFVPAVTRHRQGVHDFLAHSVVVNRRALRATNAEQRMREFLANEDPESLRHRRPSILKILIDAVALAVPIFLMSIGIQVANQKNMYARVSYAITQTETMKFAVETFYKFEGRWPASEDDLGLPLRQDYPAGGYFMLDDNGVIRIQFEVRPELKNGSILLVPDVDDEALTWNCRIEGSIENRYLPNPCRTR